MKGFIEVTIENDIQDRVKALVSVNYIMAVIEEIEATNISSNIRLQGDKDLQGMLVVNTYQEILDLIKAAQ